MRWLLRLESPRGREGSIDEDEETGELTDENDEAIGLPENDDGLEAEGDALEEGANLGGGLA